MTQSKIIISLPISFYCSINEKNTNLVCDKHISAEIHEKFKHKLSIFSGWKIHTALKVSEYGVFSDPYFPVFGLNTGNYGPEKTSYFDTFHAVTKIHLRLP